MYSDTRPRSEISMRPLATLFFTDWPRVILNSADSVCLKRILFPAGHSLLIKKQTSTTEALSRVLKWLRLRCSLLLFLRKSKFSQVRSPSKEGGFSEAGAWKSRLLNNPCVCLFLCLVISPWVRKVVRAHEKWGVGDEGREMREICISRWIVLSALEKLAFQADWRRPGKVIFSMIDQQQPAYLCFWNKLLYLRRVIDFSTVTWGECLGLSAGVLLKACVVLWRGLGNTMWFVPLCPRPVDGGLPGCSAVKNLPVMQEMWVRSLGWEDHGNPLQCSCLGNPRYREAWRATVHGAAKELDTT